MRIKAIWQRIREVAERPFKRALAVLSMVIGVICFIVMILVVYAFHFGPSLIGGGLSSFAMGFFLPIIFFLMAAMFFIGGLDLWEAAGQ